jgi:hypothetical protein
MIKHVGKHNNRKVVILYRTVPNESHMALVAYSDALPRILHDSIMSTLESEIGQQAKEFADALFRQTIGDGRNALNALHQEGMIKKVPTNQIIVTPTASSSVRLDELNDILAKMAGGEEAVKRMAELDNERGLKGSNKPLPKDVGEPTMPSSAGTDDVLTDAQIAQGMKDQAAKMKADASTLLAEAKRLESEAADMAPKKTTTKKSDASKKNESSSRLTRLISTQRKYGKTFWLL